ncbi:MAG: DnaJ domain-containing protein [Deltaproteobacteria bacterium]|nr:DnaJ domain-containing protein [Deltaproteobacteria bacterium]
MSISFLHEPGDLARIPFAAVLIEALNLRATGTLLVEHDGGTSKIFLRDGIPVGAQSFAGFKPLGQILMARGRIDLAMLNESLGGMAATGKRQGQVLVELGAVSQEEVDHALSEQQEAYLGRIASLERGSFRLDTQKPVPDWTRGIRIQPLRAIVRTLEKPQAEALVASALQPAAGGPLALVPGYERLAPAFGWTAAESRLVERLGGLTSLEEFFDAPGVPPERARAVLAALLLLGLVQARPGGQIVETVPGIVVDLEELAGVEEVPAEPPARPVATPPPARSVATPPPARAPPTPPPVRPAAPEPTPPRRSPPPAPSPFAPSPPPALSPFATPPPVRPVPSPTRPAPAPGRTPAPAARAATPPAGVPAAGPTPPHARRSDPEEARRRRQRLLQRAMQNMGIGPLSRPAPTPPPGAEPPPRAAPAGGQQAAPASAEERELRRGLEAVFPRARNADLFARLGLERGATREQVKQAYFQLAKQFHPDRFAQPSLADLAEKVKELFAALNESYETLYDDKRRAEWVARNAAGKPAMAAGQAEAALLDFQKGEACLRTRDLARARGFFESAIRGHGRPEYLAALAWVLAFDPKAPDRGRAKELLTRALQDPTCDRAAYTAAMVARDEGDEEAAERMFRMALRANPRHVEAEREIRLIEARRRKR